MGKALNKYPNIIGEFLVPFGDASAQANTPAHVTSRGLLVTVIKGEEPYGSPATASILLFTSKWRVLRTRHNTASTRFFHVTTIRNLVTMES